VIEYQASQADYGGNPMFWQHFYYYTNNSLYLVPGMLRQYPARPGQKAAVVQGKMHHR
jgi:hypothetical protein